MHWERLWERGSPIERGACVLVGRVPIRWGPKRCRREMPMWWAPQKGLERREDTYQVGEESRRSNWTPASEPNVLGGRSQHGQVIPTQEGKIGMWFS